MAGGRQGLEGIGADAGGESVGSTGSLSQPEGHTSTKSERDRPQSGNKAGADGGRVNSTDPAPHSVRSGFGPVIEGQHDKKGKEAAIEGREPGEGGLYLGSGVEQATDSGSSQGGNGDGKEKVDRVDLLPSTPSMKHESMQAACYSTLHL